MEWDKDWHFLKYVGGLPPKQLFKQQLDASRSVRGVHAWPQPPVPPFNPAQPENIIAALSSASHDPDSPSVIMTPSAGSTPAVPATEQTGGTIVRETA